MRVLHLVVLILCLAPAMAQAGTGCTCRANGQAYEQGQILCIRGQLSRCEMFMNTPNWKVIAESCPEVRLPAIRPLPPILRAFLSPKTRPLAC